MKRNDIIKLGLGIGGVLIVAIIAYRFLFAKKAQPVTIEIVPKVESTYDQAAMSLITNPESAVNFNVLLDLRAELGNTRPFGR